VDFNVLAYPSQTFHGTVSTVRINPQTVNNVVTYQVIVDVNNTDGKLLPGMTANATINVARANNALVVPLSALHTRPAQSVASTTGTSQQSPWGQTVAGGAGGSVAAGSNASLTVQRDGKAQRVHVHVDLVTAAAAAVTPIDGSTLSETDNVVTGTSFASHGGASSRAKSGGSPLAGGGGRGTRGIP
jgi:HlyD family secretion protein